jgi:hypothetical protein
MFRIQTVKISGFYEKFMVYRTEKIFGEDSESAANFAVFVPTCVCGHYIRVLRVRTVDNIRILRVSIVCRISTDKTPFALRVSLFLDSLKENRYGKRYVH